MDQEPAERGFKRLLFCGDFHCGHHFGLTPPDWWYPEDSGREHIAKIAKFQRALWGFATQAVELLKPIDVLFVGGDAIDGKGERSGSVELRTANRIEQTDMASEFIRLVGAPKTRLVYGTRYHTGKEEDFEEIIIGPRGGEKVKKHYRTVQFDNALTDGEGDMSIQGHGFYNVNGCIIDDKHKIGSSSVPYGRMTALARAQLWNALWAERQRQPKANIIARHHVHYHAFCGGPGWLAFTVPGLCYGTAYGIRECEGIVDIGMVYVDVFPDRRWTWDSVLADFPEMAAAVESL